MFLKKIFLKNIRSYESAEIEFTQGSTLLSGDIGSGKTSVLLAIEFALFGLQPGQRGFSLLKNGQDQGEVKIEFEIDGKEILIERTLKRAKTISQDFCAIQIDGVKQEISVTELKTKILEILNYPKEFAKKQNLLYRFTVYTPQEEMKQIILENPETRINTLRHIFGIDKYKKIIENLAIITSKIREEKRVKEALTSNLENEKENLLLKNENLENKKLFLREIEKELGTKKSEVEKNQEEEKEIVKKIEEKKNLQQEVEKTKLMLATKKESIIHNEKIIEQLKTQIEVLKKLNFDEAIIEEFQRKITILKNEKELLSEKNLSISSEIASLNRMIEEKEFLKKNLSRLETCPTCLQKVDPNYKANVQNKLENEIADGANKIKEISIKKQETSSMIYKMDSEIFDFEGKIQELKILKIKIEGMKEKEKSLAEIEITQSALQKDIVLLNTHLQSLQDFVFELNKYNNLLQEKRNQLEKAIFDERKTEVKLAELKKEMHMIEIQINEISEKIYKTEKIKSELYYLTDLENWLSKKFLPIISFIEKNVMVKLKIEFSKLFSEWFAMLVSEQFAINLREDFSPVIEQQDYELEYEYLSGGERTAIALAYRLALNQVINSFLGKIKTRDFVILDEPTDGFSEQQLDKMRDVLQELNVAQLIIVSHEQKIEGFVENVVRFAKKDGVSIIEKRK